MSIAEQIAAEKARRKAQAEQEATVQAQPGPTQAKADLDRAQRVEALTRQAVGNENLVGGGGYGVLPDTKLIEHGATLGLDVPLAGLVSGLNFWSNPETSFSERFEAGEEARRRRLNISEAEAPLPVAQEIAGTVLSGGPAGAAENFALEQAGQRAAVPAAQSILRTAAEAGGVGAGTGFVHGTATGTGDWRDRVLQGGKEALVGGVAGTTLGAGARMLQPNAAPAAARVAAADEFGIPLTRGQATADVAQQRAEQELMHGAKGDAAQREMAAHRGRVEAARGAAVEDIRDRFSPYRGGTQEESGRLLNESVRRRAERLRAVGGGRIDQALNAGAEVDAGLLRDLPNRLNARLAGPNPQVPEHYIGVNTPIAAEAMQRVDDFLRTVPTTPNTRISLAGVNQLRRNLLSLTGASDIDNRALSAIKSEVDNWITDVAGSDPALADLRHGNQLYREGSEILQPRGRDVTPAQKNVAKLASEDAVGQDAVKLFNVNQRGGVGAEATRTARELSDRFGANSPQMQRVRDISTVSLLEGGPQLVGNRIDNFLTTNRAAAEALFKPEQIAELERFRDVSRNLVSDPTAMNRGQSGYGPMKAILRSSLVGGGAILGSHLGGGGLIGDAAMTAGGALLGDTAARVQGARAVNRALQPIPSGQSLISGATDIARTAPTLIEQQTIDRLLSQIPLLDGAPAVVDEKHKRR